MSRTTQQPSVQSIICLVAIPSILYDVVSCIQTHTQKHTQRKLNWLNDSIVIDKIEISGITHRAPWPNNFSLGDHLFVNKKAENMVHCAQFLWIFNFFFIRIIYCCITIDFRYESKARLIIITYIKTQRIQYFTCRSLKLQLLYVCRIE